MNIIRIIVLLLLASVFYACTSSKPISSNKFKGYSQISQGEIATMEWDFANATNVRVDLYDKLYNAIDSAKVSPNSTKEYQITAFHKTDTVAYKWTVEVVDKNEKPEVDKPELEKPEVEKPEVDTKELEKPEVKKPAITQTKPPTEIPSKVAPKSNPDMPVYSPNSTNSDYVNGAIGPEAAPVRIKIMHSTKNDKTLELKTIILDENGNFINGLNSKVVDLSFIQKCKKSSNSAGDLQIQEVHKSEGTDYSIIFDNSSVAEFNFPLLERVLNFSESLIPEDRLMFSYFNHNYTEYLQLQPQKEFYDAFKGYDLPKPSGLSGLYKAVYSNLVDFTSKVSKDKNKAIILITYSEDNSSLIYSPDDIISAAQNFGIPIFVIAVGDAFNSYTLQKIANSTGGKLYTVHTDSSHIAEHIMKEIDFALNNHYSISLNYDNNEKECADAYGKLILKYGDKTIEDGIILNPTKSEFHSYYQSVAIFDEKSAEVSKDYEDGIIELANVLKNNPNYRIKLIGHSDDEGSKEFDAEISDSRANNIMKMIVDKGVDSNQILTGSEGFSKPLYILGQNPWQNNFNRRVELKWINPSQASPFEIVVEQVWTEEEALTASEKWSKRGYHTYFDNYLIGNEPVYRVMLWGFEDEDDVKEVASKIMKKFKIKVTYK